MSQAVPAWAGRPGSRWNLPNVLTALRVVLVPVFGVMLLTHPHQFGWRVATTLVFMVAVATDFVDGRVARKYELVTDFGKLWDPIADKAMTGMAFVGLSVLHELPWWVTIIILVREWAITVLRWAIKKYGVMAANRGGKLKTSAQSLALTLYLLWLAHLWAPIRWFAWLVMAVAFVLTVLTGLDYCREAVRLRRRALASDAGTPRA